MLGRSRIGGHRYAASSGGDDIDLLAVETVVSVGAEMLVAALDAPAEWWAQIVDRDGTRVASLPAATLMPLTETLNGDRSTSARMDVDDPAAVVVGDGSIREMQLWRGAVLVHQGPITDVDISLDECTVSSHSPMWYLDHAVVGPLGNQWWPGANWDFRRRGQSWRLLRTDTIAGIPTFQGYTFQTDPAAATGHFFFDTATKPPGAPMSLRYYIDTADPADHLACGRPLSVTTGDTPIRVIFVARTRIASGTATVPLRNRGVLVTQTPQMSEWETPYPAGLYTENLPDEDQSYVRDDHARNKWVTHAAATIVPPNVSRLVWCSMWSVKGAYQWWAPSPPITDEAIARYGADLGLFIADLVDHASDPTSDKWADLTIDHDIPTIGVTGDWMAQHSSHERIGQLIRRYATEGHYDISERIRPAIGTTAGQTTIVLHPRTYGRQGRGVYRSGLGVRFGPDGRGIGDEVRRQWQGSNAANAVAAQSVAVGPYIEERPAMDADAFGGPILEAVEVAPDTITGARLDAWASRRLALLAHPEVVAISCAPGDRRSMGLGVGDTIDVAIDYGALQVDARYRVVSKTLDPATDIAAFTLEWWSA